MAPYHIPNYKLHTFFASATRVSAVAAAFVICAVSGNLFYQYRNATNPSFDESREIRIDCDPRSPKASFPSQYTPYAQFEMQPKMNCDSSGHGVCIVQQCVIRTHSHAGTHADQPKHFVENPLFNRFPDEYYNGEVLVLNLSDRINPKDPKIDEDLLENAFKEFENMKMFKVETPFLSTVVNRLRNRNRVKRILIKTVPGEHNEWDTLDKKTPPYFTVTGADFLVKNFPDLCLIGIDSISVDHPQASPIAEHVHGVFWKNKIAILENLRLNQWNRNVQVGKIRTYWNPYQVFEDALGCIVTFTPAHDPLERVYRGMQFDYVVRDKEFQSVTEKV